MFLLDAEADSVFHWRWWQRRHCLFLVRGDDDRTVRLGSTGGAELLLPDLVQRRRQTQAFQRVRAVEYDGRKVGHYVAETTVVVERPAWLHREVEGVRKRWYRLTHVPAAVRAATIAFWYYWRWKRETFFKLLKGAGPQGEHWQQEEGVTILKRLLVASLAWRLGHSTAPQAAAARRVVRSLSGRPVEYGKDSTLEALVAGTWVLLAMTALLEQTPAGQLRQRADLVLNGSVHPNAQQAPLRDAG